MRNRRDSFRLLKMCYFHADFLYALLHISTGQEYRALFGVAQPKSTCNGHTQCIRVFPYLKLLHLLACLFSKLLDSTSERGILLLYPNYILKRKID